MFRLTGEAKYLDLAELVLYNGASRVSRRRGDRFFYQNPLASNGKVERSAVLRRRLLPGESRANARVAARVDLRHR